MRARAWSVVKNSNFYVAVSKFSYFVLLFETFSLEVCNFRWALREIFFHCNYRPRSF